MEKEGVVVSGRKQPEVKKQNLVRVGDMVDGSGKRGILQFRILEVVQFQVMTVSRLFHVDGLLN